jgi:major membrane immunogen (membrane-anchored lipoprotein)
MAEDRDSSKDVVFTWKAPNKSIKGKDDSEGFVIDAFMVESYSFTNSVTNIPVEEGSTISDHVVEEQDVVSIQAFIGNAEFIAADSSDSLSKEPPDRMARVLKSYKELLRLKRTREVCTVTTGLDVYTDMIITSLNIDRDVETGANLPFSMEFKRIKIVKPETVAINAGAPAPGSGAAADQVAGTVNEGTASTKEPDENQEKEHWKMEMAEGAITNAYYTRRWGTVYPN